MDFAKRILGKYGWKEGDGLGKNSDGIVKPLKASMKFDNAGLGADQAASDFNNHWWERVFNEAAQNVKIKAQENGAVSMELKNHEDSVEISTKGYSLKKLKNAKANTGGSDARYDNFLQAATLTKAGDEVENPDKIAVADIAVTQYKVLTDEELFKACGGRTAHKGARHGLKLSGKLSRVERQEQELLARMQQKLQKKEEAVPKEEKSKKKKKHKDDEREDCAILNTEEHSTVPSDETNAELQTKKKKKSKRKADAVEEDCSATNGNEVTAEIKKKKKKQKRSKPGRYYRRTSAESCRYQHTKSNKKEEEKEECRCHQRSYVISVETVNK